MSERAPEPGGPAGAIARDATEARPLVRLRDLSRSFGRVRAVDHVGLDIHAGELLAFLGPSGCGKTTLLRMLAGFERPDAGRIELAGQDVTDVPPWRRPVNMMFQAYALFPHLSVAGNIAFGLRREGLPRAEIAARVQDALRLAQLEGLGDRRPDRLSGGQRQRVALARAIVKRPKLLLLDEPLSALDRKLRERTRLELVGIQRRLGITFVVVTHDQEEAMTVATRIAVMNEGRIVQVGTPAEVYERPRSRFVASFVGDVTLLEARVVGRDGPWLGLRAVETGTTVRVSAGYGLTAGQTVWVALRPEQLAIAAAPPAEPHVNALAGAVEDVAYRGDASILHVRLAGGGTMRASRPGRGGPAAMSGARVWLTWTPDAAVVLEE